MKVQRVIVSTYDDVEAGREGRPVVVGMAEYLEYSKRTGKPAVELFTSGIDVEGWAYVTWCRLRRAEPETTPTEFEGWTKGIAQALPEIMVRALEVAEAQVTEGAGAGAEVDAAGLAGVGLDPTVPEPTASLTATPTD